MAGGFFNHYFFLSFNDDSKKKNQKKNISIVNFSSMLFALPWYLKIPFHTCEFGFFHLPSASFDT